MHVVGAFLPSAFAFRWQSMQVPDLAVGLWNAAWVNVFMGGTAGFTWQLRHACCGAEAGFSGLDAW